MNYILLLLLSLILFIANNFLLTYLEKIFYKINIVDQNFDKPQAFHSNPTPRIGGLFFLINIILISLFYSFFSDYKFYSILGLIPFFFIGFLDDIKILEEPRIKVIILNIIIIFFLYFSNIDIINTGVVFLNSILSNYLILKYLFLLLCFLTIINGSNFIDGFNGLLLIHSIIILTSLYYINYNNVIEDNLIIVIFCLLIILFLNFPFSKLFLGDSGAYSVGFLISYFVIQTSNLNLNISPFFFCILLFYLFFEVLFSFFRKRLIKQNPLFPDKNHLHMLLFRTISKKINNNKKKSNYLTSLYINLFYLAIISPSFFFLNNNYLCKLYFIFCIIIYIFFYIFLKKIEKN